ncbi:MAG: AAA family ATPase [Desulfobacterales bacterium]|nr:AAA family ATPase [Desulfobacterales bacterium]
MYLSYYNLNEKPFQISTDPKFLWLGEKHKEALAILTYGILDNKGFLLLTGDVGTGKTTIINTLLNNLDDDVIAAHVPDPDLEHLDFFNFIANVFSIDKKFSTKGEFLNHLSKFLHDAYSKNKKVLLIIDEAQRLKPELLEEIRLLSNIERQDTKLLNIFFVGQEEFNNVLIEPENRALRQRITINYYIEPLTENETKEYIKHRLNIAGSKRNIFSSSAIREIFSFSKGFPRLINIICDLALLTGYVKEQKTINELIIKECAKELQIPTEKAIEDDKKKQKIVPQKSQIAESDPKQEVALIESQTSEDDSKQVVAPIESQIAENESNQEVKRGGLKPAVKVLGCFFLLVSLFILTWLYINYPAEFKTKLSNINTYTTQIIGNIKSKSEQLLQSSSTTINSKPVVQKYSIDRIDSGQNKQVQISEEQDELLEDKNISNENLSDNNGDHLDKLGIVPKQIPDKNIIIYFRYNSNELSDDALIKLDEAAEIMTQNPYTNIIIKGYTDIIGNYDYNKGLSLFRADIVKSFLAGKGINPTKIKTIGMGPENPIDTNETAKGRRNNRRVEIEFLKPKLSDFLRRNVPIF